MCVCACVCVCVCVYMYVYLNSYVLIVVNSLPNISNGFKGGIREDSDIGASIRYC